MKAVRYKSSDGLEVPAYLTLPKGPAPKNLTVPPYTFNSDTAVTVG